MSAMAADVEFTAWLGKKLTELNTDEGVFGAYIEGILTSNETAEEKSEALQSILSGIIDNVGTPHTTLVILKLSRVILGKRYHKSLQ